MDISKVAIKQTKAYVFPRIKSSLKHIKLALRHMDEVSKKLSILVDNEGDLSEMEREILYSYGLDRAKIHLMRLSNVKKSLENIVPNGNPR